MNSNKIAYWNTLRAKLNKWFLLISGIKLLIVLFISKTGLITSFIIPYKFSNIFISNVIGFVIYFSLINFILIVIEMLDRITSFNEKALLKKYFKYVIFTIFLLFPVSEVLFSLTIEN